MRHQAFESFKIIIAVVVGLLLLITIISLIYIKSPNITFSVNEKIINSSFTWGEK